MSAQIAINNVCASECVCVRALAGLGNNKPTTTRKQPNTVVKKKQVYFISTLHKMPCKTVKGLTIHKTFL